MATDIIGVDQLLDRALAQAPATAFADLAFVPNLDRLLKAIERAPLTEAGHQGMIANIDRLLVNRLRYEADVARHPEILDEDVSDPIVVLGLPRSGTTKLQRFLSADPNVRGTALWQLLNPAPFPDEERGNPWPRLEWGERMMSVASHTQESYRKMHDFKAAEPDETSFLEIGNFDSVMQFIPLGDADYLAWARTLSRIPALDYVRRMLQYLQWQDGGRRDRPWVLKNPGHTGEIAEMAELFPNATFVISERDLATTMGSSMRMLTEIRGPSFRTLDQAALGDDTVDYWAYELDRYQRQRAALGDRVRIVETPYRRCVDDALSVAREIYELAGMPWTREGEQAMRAWDEGNPRHKHGGYSYALEDYGWSTERVEAAFGPIAAAWRGR